MLCAVFPIGAYIIALMSLGQSDIVSTQHCVTFLYKEEFISLSSTPPPPVRTINKWKITFLHFVQEKIHEENILIFFNYLFDIQNSFKFIYQTFFFKFNLLFVIAMSKHRSYSCPNQPYCIYPGFLNVHEYSCLYPQRVKFWV